MSKIIPLFSGSKGNCFYISSNGRGIIIDIGRSTKQILDAMSNFSLSCDKTDGILITHEHSDHISGLKVFTSKFNMPVFASAGTISELLMNKNISGYNVNTLLKNNDDTYCDFELGEFLITPFKTSHDASESTGFKINLPDGKKICFATDLGYISETVKRHLLGCDAVVIESNHDVGMLKNGSYPYILKRRILSDKGHLSNDSCAEILPELVKNGTTRIMLAHLSRENNYPDLAYHTSLVKLNENGMSINSDFTLDVAREVYDNTMIYF